MPSPRYVHLKYPRYFFVNLAQGYRCPFLQWFYEKPNLECKREGQIWLSPFFIWTPQDIWRMGSLDSQYGWKHSHLKILSELYSFDHFMLSWHSTFDHYILSKFHSFDHYDFSGFDHSITLGFDHSITLSYLGFVR